jgi:hypothetical protein
MKMCLRLLPVALMLATLANLWGAETSWITNKFKASDALFANPGQGWMSQNRKPSGEPRFPCSVVYIRFGWADAEPEKGKYQWNVIDDAIANWKSRDATISMRVMATSAHSKGYYCSPKWLFDGGCKGFEYEVGGDDPTKGGHRILRIEPDYSDPIFLAEHGRFITELGQRYDGHPAIEFLDIGSYGMWGEWHTKHPAPVEIRKRIVDMYLKAFRKTPLVFMSDDAEVLKYALEHGTGFRRDGVGSPTHEQNWIGSKKYAEVTTMADTWKTAPVVFEWYGDYAYLQSRKWSFDAAINFMLQNHVTLINDNIGKFPPEALPQLQKLARLAGYRFTLREVAHERNVRAGGSLNVHMLWANVGVGKLYRPYSLRLSLLDGSNRAVCTTDAQADPREWLPGEHPVQTKMNLPTTMKAGTYTLAVSLEYPAGKYPPLKLANELKSQNGKYPVGTVSVGNR